MLANKAYFNTAQSCPLPTQVAQAAIDYWQRIGASADIDWRREVEHLGKLRARLAQFIGADASEIVLVDNATVAPA